MLCAQIALAIVVLALPQSVAAGSGCLSSATAMRRSCNNEVREEYWASVAICHNEDPGEQGRCFDEASEARGEGEEECVDVHEARKNVCELLGENRYDPEFDPEDFTTEFNNNNPYFPLAPGNRWVLEAEDETIELNVLAATKLIDEVTCIVLNDRVEGETAIEDTDDWYAQALDGSVWYCGELSRDFEIFEDDDPPTPELIAIDGSFKADRDGAEPGILMLAAPRPGDRYRQEWALGEAEDLAEVLSSTYGYGSDPELDEFAPQDLVEHLCHDDCVVTKDVNPHDPGEFEHKYYAPGIGLFLEIKPEEGEVTRLVECNVSPLCDSLPE